MNFSSDGTIEKKEVPTFASPSITPINPPRIDFPKVVDSVRADRTTAINNTGIQSEFTSLLKQLITSVDTNVRINVSGKQEVSNTESELANVLNRLNNNLENPKPVKSFVVYQELENEKVDLDKIRAYSGLRR